MALQVLIENHDSNEKKTIPITEPWNLRVGFMSEEEHYGNQEGSALYARKMNENGFPALSRDHCELAYSSGTLRVKDFGSRTGTYVNGERISEAKVVGEREVFPGDKVELIPVMPEFAYGPGVYLSGCILVNAREFNCKYIISLTVQEDNKSRYQSEATSDHSQD